MAHLPKTTTREDVIDAMTRFDQEQRTTPAWTNWHESKAQCFAIQHSGQLYPPKMIVALATGCAVSTFSGGTETNTWLARRGFEIVALRQKPQVPSYPPRYAAVLEAEPELVRQEFEVPVLDGKMTYGQYLAALHALNDWRYLIVKSGGMATKSACDSWLIGRYGISESDARTMSNKAEQLPCAFQTGGGTRWLEYVALRPEPEWKDIS